MLRERFLGSHNNIINKRLVFFKRNKKLMACFSGFSKSCLWDSTGYFSQAVSKFMIPTRYLFKDTVTQRSFFGYFVVRALAEDRAFWGIRLNFNQWSAFPQLDFFKYHSIFQIFTLVSFF